MPSDSKNILSVNKTNKFLTHLMYTKNSEMIISENNFIILRRIAWRWWFDIVPTPKWTSVVKNRADESHSDITAVANLHFSRICLKIIIPFF